MDEIELIKKLVSINSVFPNEKEIAVFLEDYLKSIGFSVERQYVSENRFNIFAQRKGVGNPILFYGHMDTVPAYGEWKKNPFILFENEDRLEGLGAWDMKGGICAILKAVEKNTDRAVKIIFGVDEENISEGAFNIIQKKDFFNGIEGIIVTESGDSKKEHMGPQMITLGRRGRVVFEINIIGKSRHGAANESKTPIYVAAEIIQMLEKQKMIRHKYLPSPNQFIRKIVSQTEGLTIPDKVVIELDRHMVPPETKEGVLEELKKAISKFQKDNINISVSIKTRKTPFLDAYITDKKNPFVKKISKIIKNKYGSVSYNYGRSVADECHFASLGFPVITIGPKGANDHNPEEWLSKKSYLELIDILFLIIGKY